MLKLKPKRPIHLRSGKNDLKEPMTAGMGSIPLSYRPVLTCRSMERNHHKEGLLLQTRAVRK